ncbi:unnamed protein product [Miscanthus lutarioriparius]|uniref:Bet v I/Major latex protein domain-containing protein n=2 Tax=Miscanthus TaxID=62336 RepID=A0A811MJN7_9POAL|nr:unnamed protein product [Miscanthus lutarioriparius]
MASTNSWTLEIPSPVAAPRLFRAAVMDWHTLAPKVASHVVASAHPVEGDGGVGSVRQFNFTSVMPFTFTKERLDFLDLDKCECKQTLLEGGGIGVAIETATSHIKVEPAADGGSVAKVETTFKPLPGVELKDEITKAKESLTAIFKGAEAYLHRPTITEVMASANSWTLEIASPVAAPRLFRAAVLDWHNLAPKLASHVVASAHPVEGDGGVGSIRQFNFTSVMPFTFTKERLDFLDLDKCECKQTLLEGGGIGVAIETATSHIKVEPAADGGSVAKVETTFKPLPGVELKDEITKAKESLTAIFKVMASTNSWTLEIPSPVAAPRLFRAAVMDWHTLAPKVASHVVASAHPVEGDGGVGSVRQFNFTSVMPFSFMKERLEFLDVDKCECKNTLIEGGGIGVAIETAASHIKVEPAADGGSVVKVESTYKLLPGVDVKDEEAKAKEAVTAIFKGAEAYLVANPDAYN